LITSILGWLGTVAGDIPRRDRHAFFLATRDNRRAKLRYLLFHLENANERDRIRWRRPFRLVATYGHPWPILKKLIGRS